MKQKTIKQILQKFKTRCEGNIIQYYVFGDYSADCPHLTVISPDKSDDAIILVGKTKPEH